MADREIPGMKPPVLEGPRRRGRVLQIALHQGIAAQHQLAHRMAVRRDIGHRPRIDDALAVEGQVGNSLARDTGGTLCDR